MQSTPFRLATAVIATLLLAALAYVIFFALQNPPPVAPAPPISRSTAASAALTPATGTAIAATVTFTPSMAVAVADASAATTPPTAQMAAAQTLPMATANVVITGAGFVYTPLEGFMVTETDSSATLTRRGANGSLSTIFLLSGGPPQQFIEQPGTQLAARFEQFVNFFAARDNFDTGDIEETSVDAVDALRVDLISSAPENRFRGRIVMAQPAPDRLFIMTGIAPEEIWNINGAGAYGEVLRSVRLFDPETFDPEIFATQGAQAAGIDTDPTSIAAALQPTATATARATPTAAPTPSPIPDSEPLPPPAAAIAQPPGWQLYANANIVHDAVLVRDALWLATSGGIVARNASTDSYVKFSPLEGLARNSATSVTHCPLPGLGLVFGGDGGLLLFDTRNGTWNSLDSANSGMAFDDVTSVQCVAESGLLIIGYRRHGLDLYDVTGAAWTHIDRDDGLVNDFAEVVATDSRGDTIWVSSGFGVTVLRRIGTTVTREAFYSAENSPLADNRIHTIVLEESGVAWIGAPDAVYHIEGGRWTTLATNQPAGIVLPPAPLAALASAPNGDIWAASAGGEICKLSLPERGCETLLSMAESERGADVTHLLVDPRNNVYSTTNGSGLTLWEEGKPRRLQVPGELLATNRVDALSLDSEGFVWLAGDGLVQQINPSEPTISRSYTRSAGTLPIEDVRVLARGAMRGLWAGGLGAALFDGSEWRTFSTEDGLAGNVVQAIASDDTLRTWIGTKTGLSIWNGDSFFNLDQTNGLPSENITALVGDGASMWIGSSGGGLYRFDQNQLRLFNSENAELPSNMITALARLTDGLLLVGTDQGLATFRDGAATVISDVPPMYINTIQTTDDDVVWVGVREGGIYSFEDGVWQAGSPFDPLPTDDITSILVDQYGSIWFGGATGGIARYFESVE